MDADSLKKQVSDVFNSYAQDGIDRFTQQFPAAGEPVLSHLAFKFDSMEAYAETVAAAHALGRVTQEQFNGKEITWVRLAAPLEKNGLRLEYLEMVEPKTERHAFNGVANIGYAVEGLADVKKLPSSDGGTSFRYQSQHARQMAPE